MMKVSKSCVDVRFLVLFSLFFLYSGCAPKSDYLVGDGGGPYKMILFTEGNKWVPGNPTEMSFQLVDSRTDKPIKNLQLAHERLMHIFITDERLEYFAHVHVSEKSNEQGVTEGRYYVNHTFERPGFYRLVVEFVHLNRIWHKSFTLPVIADPGTSQNIKERANRSSEYQLKLEAPDEIKAGKEVELAVVMDRDGLPVSNLQLFMGSELHGAVWREDLEDFGHLHSFTPKMRELLDEIRSRGKNGVVSPSQLQAALVEVMCGKSQLVFRGPLVPLRYTFPNKGIYHLFLQVAPDGRPITMKFLLEVGQ